MLNKRIYYEKLEEKLESIMEGNFVKIENYEVEDVMFELRERYNIKIVRMKMNDFNELIISLAH